MSVVSALPARSLAPVLIVADWKGGGEGKCVGVGGGGLITKKKVPATGVVPCIRVKVVVLIVEGSIASLNVAMMVWSSRTFVVSLAGPVAARTGAVESGATPVVKLQLMSLVSGLPARSLAPVLIV